MGDRVAVIRKGELQQIDTPREIYLYPKNILMLRINNKKRFADAKGAIA